MYNESLDTVDTKNILPLPVRGVDGVYSIEATDVGRELHTKLGELNEQRLNLYREQDIDTNLKDFAESAAETAVMIGRALDIMPHISDRTLVKEADFLYEPEIRNANVLVNTYGNVALSISPGFGKEADGSFFVEFALVKQGEQTAVKVKSCLKVESDGKISFIPRRSESGGSLDGIITIESGRVVADIAATPDRGVFSAGFLDYKKPSKEVSPIPFVLKQEPWLNFVPHRGQIVDDDYDYKGIDGVKGKQINFSKVLEFMQKPDFDGKKEITDHKEVITQLLENRIEK